MVLVNGCDRFYYFYILKLKLSSKWMDENMKKDLRCQKKMKAMKLSSIAQINIIKQQHSIICINYHLKLC